MCSSLKCRFWLSILGQKAWSTVLEYKSKEKHLEKNILQISVDIVKFMVQDNFPSLSFLISKGQQGCWVPARSDCLKISSVLGRLRSLRQQWTILAPHL